MLEAKSKGRTTDALKSLMKMAPKTAVIEVDGKEQEVLADELLAIILQHEIDHLDGVLYIDHLSRLKRSRLLKKLEKFRAERSNHEEKAQA